MSYNGSGTFQINTSGQPVVAGTVISSTAFNALTADLATGLSTAITKDGQTTTTARIPFAQGISSTLTTDSSSTSTGSIITAGGVGIAKALYVGTTANIAGTTNLAGLTASSAVATDASKNLVSVTNTGTGNNVLATSPTLVTPILGTPTSGIMTNVTGINYDGFKNRIINGAMVISQRNGTSSVSATGGGQYFLDRWSVNISAGSKFTVAQSSTAPTGFNSSSLITSSSAYSITSGDFFAYQQFIEGYNIADLGWGTASASTVTLSFWVRSSLTGTFGGTLANSTNTVSATRSYPFTYTISSANTWEQKTLTITGDTTGTWGTTNAGGIAVLFGLGVGSTYSGTAGAWAGVDYRSATGATSVVGTNGATFYITGVQLEKGSTATSFDYRPYTTELQLCQRYFEKSFDIGTAVAQNSGTYNGTSVAASPGQLSGMAFGDTRFKINKRTAATLTFYNPAAANAFARDQNAGVDCTATSAWMAGESSFAISASTGIGSGATNRIAVHWSASSEL